MADTTTDLLTPSAGASSTNTAASSTDATTSSDISNLFVDTTSPTATSAATGGAGTGGAGTGGSAVGDAATLAPGAVTGGAGTGGAGIGGSAVGTGSLLTFSPPNYLDTIKTALVDAQTAENGLFNGPLPPPNRFYVVDQSTGATSATPGDRFNGVTAGIISQNIHNSTSDNYFISALTPGVFISTDRGNDVLIASGWRNIFDGGSGRDTFVGASGQDTFIAGISTASSTDTLINFKSGDDLAVVGLTRADFNYSAKDTSVGLEIDATPKAPGAPSETIVLPGYTRSDLVGGGRFAVGIGSSNGVNFLFVHAN